jgi:hypothetical protein
MCTNEDKLTAMPLDNHLLAGLLSEQEPGRDRDWDAFSAEDWSLVVRRAQAEGVGPLLYQAILTSGKIALLPKPDQELLRVMYYGTKLINEQILQEVGVLTGLFDQAGIPVVALKGVCFVLTIYLDPGLRPMADVDLLVPSSQISAALHIVRSSGYVDVIPDAFPGLDQLLNHATCLKKTKRPFTILEVHHTLVAAEGSFAHAVPVDWFWGQTEAMSDRSSVAWLGHLHMLTPTAQLLYACAHAMLQHGGRDTSLRWLYDLDLLVRVYAERLDWDLLLSQARKFEWGSAVRAALSQAVEFFDTPVPKNILENLARNTDRHAGRVAEMQALPATHTLEEYQKLKSLNAVGRLKLIVALTVPTPAYMRWRYGLKANWAIPVWYPYRWWGIVKDAIRTLGLLLKNNHPRTSSTLDNSPDRNE